MSRLRDSFDALVTQLFQDRSWANLPSVWDEAGGDIGWVDNESEYLFEAELPGFEPEEIDVQIRGNYLTIKAEHREESGDKGGPSHDVRYGSYARTFPLPQGSEPEKVDANYRNGVLQLRLPKGQSVPTKRVTVHAAK